MPDAGPTVWIDLANSPHVLFFAPLVREFSGRGAEVRLTCRDFAQTVGLAALHGLSAEAIGVHGGSGLSAKGCAIIARARALRHFAKRERPDLAVSHNSYAQALAARALGIRTVTLMDYEHTPANHLSFRAAQRILLPEAIPLDAVRRYGATRRKVVHYPGFKEQVYLDGFVPDRARLSPGLPADLWERYVVVVARPPADFAVYHRFENPLFEAWLGSAGADPAVRVILLPRTPRQAERVHALALPSVIVPEAPLDGANLVYHADLVVSAGGTMNREAAVLGVPAYSLFAGRPAAVDRALEALGRLTFVRQVADLPGVRLVRRTAARPLEHPGLAGWIAERVLSEAQIEKKPPTMR